MAGQSILIINWLVLMLLLIAPFSAIAKPSVRVGVLAYRGSEEVLTSWRATAAYLSREIPEYSFLVVPLAFDEINEAVRKRAVDFVITNPTSYIELGISYGISRIATMERLHGGREYNMYGGVIFCRSDRSDIRVINDLKGKSFLAVHPSSFGGWLISERELQAHGINPSRHFSSLNFAGSQDEVVSAVRDRKVDAGTVRSGVLEWLAEEGKLDLGVIKIINPLAHEGFPFLHSSRLYPEWAFATLRDTSGALAKMVASALLRMPSSHPAATSARISGWTIPLDYQPVHDLMKELRLRPYEDYGRVTLVQAITRFWPGILLFLVVNFLLGSAALYLLRLKREIGERKRVEESLREKEYLLSESQRIAHIGSWSHDMAGRLTWTDELYRLHGVSPSTFSPDAESFLTFIHPEDRPAMRNWIQDFLAGKKGGELEYRSVRADGAVHYLCARGELIYDANNMPTGMTGTAQDITAHKVAEAELQKALRKREELEFIINKSPAVVFLWRAAAGWPVEYVSANIRQLGYTPEDFIDGHVAFADVIHRDDLERVSREVAEYAESGASEFRQEYRLLTKSGDVLWTDDITWVRRDQNGNITHYQGIVLDVTERKKAEAELRRYQEQLKELVAERTQDLEKKNQELEKSQIALQYLLEDVNEARRELETKIAEIERMNRIFVHRELRMVELKERIRKLEQEDKVT